MSFSKKEKEKKRKDEVKRKVKYKSHVISSTVIFVFPSPNLELLVFLARKSENDQLAKIGYLEERKQRFQMKKACAVLVLSHVPCLSSSRDVW